MRKSFLAVSLLIAFTACSAGAANSLPTTPATAVAGGLTGGLIAYVTAAGIGVLDPATGKSMIMSPLPEGGAFRVAGPVWGPAPGVAYPMLYFTVHDDRPAERRSSPGVVPYDWLFRIDPFKGVITALAAGPDFQSEGPFGLAANTHYVALTLGCCTDYEVDALDLTVAPGPLKVVTKPPAQAALFTEGADPGLNGLIVVRAFAGGGWFWLNADAGVLNPFPLTPGPDDGPVDVSPDGKLAAVSRPDKGPVIQSLAAPAKAAHVVNARLGHADGLGWSPDQARLAIASGGSIGFFNPTADLPPTATYLAGQGVASLDWSPAIPGETYGDLKQVAGPLAQVDGLLMATKLPAAADTTQARSSTRVYMWQFDSSKPSPIATIADATPAVLAQYPPQATTLNFHHWAPNGTWGLLGGCYRYRVVVTGSVAPVATTFGLNGSTPCA